MPDYFGGLTLPIPDRVADPIPEPKTHPVGDPVLDVLLPFLMAAVNADTKEAWSAVHPAAIKPHGEALPVSFTFFHDPDETSFSGKTLPALFGWRASFGAHARFTQDWRSRTSTIALLWVPPHAQQETARVRQPFRNVIDAAITSALESERHPAWRVSGDADPLAAEYGSLLTRFAGVSQAIKVTATQPHEFTIQSRDGSGKIDVYDALLVQLEVFELHQRRTDQYVALDHVQGTMRLGDPATPPTLTEQSFTFKTGVSAISPATGPHAGGTTVAITGTELVDGMTVTIGGALCTDVVLTDDRTLVATTPAHAAGVTDVVVTAPSGDSATLAAAFTFT